MRGTIRYLKEGKLTYLSRGISGKVLKPTKNRKKMRYIIDTNKLLNLKGMYFSRLLTISRKKGFSVLKKYRLILEEV